MAEKRPPRVTGPGHDTFWEYCGKGELRLQRCNSCGHIAWPVVDACEACASEDFAWARMSGRGTLASWCTFERPYYGDVMPVPYETIVVALEEGPYFVSNPQGFGHDQARAGMPVRVAFIDCEDTAGRFSLPVFEKA